MAAVKQAMARRRPAGVPAWPVPPRAGGGQPKVKPHESAFTEVPAVSTCSSIFRANQKKLSFV